jgi:ATP-dependent protease ClpP protease subunit
MSTQPTVIEFMAPVVDVTINALLGAIHQKIQQGQKAFTLLISTPGGSVFHGLTAYNLLKGMPIELTTHNVGSVDSIGVVLYCAGQHRYCVPQARFLLHGVSANFPQAASLEEKQLEERLKGLRSDIENISRVVAENTGKPVKSVMKAMIDRTTLNPEQGVSWGLVQEIRQTLYASGSDVVQIHFSQKGA